MKEAVYKAIAQFLRNIPSFKGKQRIMRTVKRVFISKNQFLNPKVWIKMKAKFWLLIDLRNGTDSGAFASGLYDSSLINKFINNFQQDWVVLDVGSNIGFYSIPFSFLTKNINTRIYSFEPVTANYNSLVEAKKKNNCDNLFTYNFGLGERVEELGICLTEEGDTGNAVITNDTLKNERGFQATEMVKIETLDKIYSEQGLDKCDFIKVDIEGAEIFFIRGAKKVIEKHRPIIYGEFNPYFIKRNNLDMKEIWDYFSNLNYLIYQQEGPVGVPFDSFKKLDSYQENICNLLLIPNEYDKETIARWIK